MSEYWPEAPPSGMAEALPEAVAIELPNIATDAMQAAFNRIAADLLAEGFATTGDLDPHELEEIAASFRGYVRRIALNNADIAAMNDPSVPSVLRGLEATEPSGLMDTEQWSEYGITAVRVTSATAARTYWPLVDIYGSRGAIRAFVDLHWNGTDDLDQYWQEIEPTDTEGA